MEIASKHRFSYIHPGSWPFWAIHLIAIAGLFYFGWSWTGFALALASYAVRMFFVTGGYHRYFSHRSYKTSRWFQAVLAFFCSTTAQKGVLWWAAHHRDHHKYSDTENDVHSPARHGFWYSHVGWILNPKTNGTDYDRVKDLAKFPELVWLNRWHLIPPVIYAVAFYLVGGWFALFWGFFFSTVLLWHGTFTINSLTHLWGKRRFESGDDSKNHWLLAIITLGEGWHNNHHYYQSSTRQGFYWWEYDITYYVIRMLGFVGLVWEIREPPARILEEGRQNKLTRAPSVTTLSPKQTA
ncbi:MAG: fatty acid desaturase [Myxococcales bacterium]|nr:MAG: fatty acid desaturase [Myxococcales bacterium]